MSTIPKYIIYGQPRKFLMSFSVSYHAELIPKDGSKNLVMGGGRINGQDDAKVILLYWESSDFGPAKKEDVFEAVTSAIFPEKWNGYTVYYARLEAGLSPDQAWREAEKILTITELISPNNIGFSGYSGS